MAALKGAKNQGAWGYMSEDLEIIYDFSKDGGAVGALDVFTATRAVVIEKAYVVVETAATSGGAATISVGKSGDAAGVVAATAVASFASGAAVAGVANLAYAVAAGEVIQMSIAVAALTAGKLRIRFKLAARS